jgi:hypothetical protein
VNIKNFPFTLSALGFHGGLIGKKPHDQISKISFS